MRIQVCSKEAAAGFECDRPWCAISISTRAGMWPELKSVNRIGLLRLAFPDYDLPRAGGINSDHAKSILEFVRENEGKAEVLLVHCEAGTSRSPAVAAAISKLRGDDDSDYFERYTPNDIVYNCILREGAA